MYAVSIGIPTLNESATISNFLQSLKDQKCTNFFIKEIIFVDDSSDDTPHKIRKFFKNYPQYKIKIIHNSERKGASYAWSLIFQTFSSDILILYDADVILYSDCTCQLITSIISGGDLCATNSLPIHNEDRIGRATNFVSLWLRNIRNRMMSQYTVMGRGLAIRSEIAKKIHLPNGIIAIDLFLQCKAMELGYKKIVYNDNAKLLFYAPNNLLDFLSQIRRADKGHKQIENLIENLKLKPSLNAFLSVTIRTIFADPIGFLSFITYMFLYILLKGKLEKKVSYKWERIESAFKDDYEIIKKKYNI